MKIEAIGIPVGKSYGPQGNGYKEVTKYTTEKINESSFIVTFETLLTFDFGGVIENKDQISVKLDRYEKISHSGPEICKKVSAVATERFHNIFEKDHPHLADIITLSPMRVEDLE